MELSFGLNYLSKRRGENEPRDFSKMVELCRDAGFRYVDYTPDFRSDDFERRAYSDREILDRAGITVEQTHMPFNRYQSHSEEIFPVLCERTLLVSKIVGAKYVVVHADEYKTRGRYDTKEILDFTYDYLAPYVEYAEKNGMGIAVENVFEDNTYRYPQVDGKSRFTSRVEELKAVIERFGTPSVTCCWDFGHAKCAFGNEEMLDALKQVGKYVSCTHVHDNYYQKDLHLPPFWGEIDWEAHIDYLKEIGYDGKFSFELVYGKIPDALLPMWMKAIYETGKYITSL